MVKVGIAGGSGYGGAELIHVLLRHPEVEIVWLSSQQHAGKNPGEVYPSLRGFLDLNFSRLEELRPADLDVLFLSLPHGQAMKLVPGLPAELLVIDLSGDFRLSDPEVFEEFYQFPMAAIEEQKQFVYGLPEINRGRIISARRIANPGCFATATILALHPLVKEGWISGPVYVDAKTGSSGAGNSPAAGTHHPRRSNSLFPYKPFRHQHLPEIRQALGNPSTPLIFQPYSAPFVRGIFSSHYMELNRKPAAAEVCSLFLTHYGADRFIRWVGENPDVNYVRHSNYVDIGAALQGSFLTVWSALDNLQKGAAGQAVQNMNLACGFPEEAALSGAPVFP
jgi:N-acetyl-gamma-glutamyl-phosphate reductase common form